MCIPCFISLLFVESGVLLGFSKAPSRPSNSYGEDHGYRYIVLERLEYDLMKLAESPVPISKISKIGIEILEGFQELHSRNYCFGNELSSNLKSSDRELHS